MSTIIVIEGPDRVGKATQSKILCQRLTDAGYTATIVEVPIRSNPVYHFIYWMLRNGIAKKFPKFFQWNQYFNRQIFQWFTLPHLEEKFDYIIMDRWSLSTVVYGAATGVSEKFTNKLFMRLRQPYYTFILLGESHKHDHEDVYESDSALQESVRRHYKEWAQMNSYSCSVVDCNNPKSVVSDQIWKTLQIVETQPTYNPSSNSYN